MPEMGLSGSEGGVALITPSLPLSAGGRDRSLGRSGHVAGWGPNCYRASFTLAHTPLHPPAARRDVARSGGGGA